MNKTRGFTILEVLIAVGIMSIVSLGIATLMDAISTSTATQRYTQDKNVIAMEIRTRLADRATCTRSFLTPIVPKANVTGLPGVSYNRILDSTGATIYDTIATAPTTVYGDHSLQISSINLQNYSDVPTPSRGIMDLVIVYQSLSKVYGTALLPSTIKMEATLDAGNNVISCVAISTGQDELWQIVPFTNTDIYYNAGNVGIGTAAPTHIFEISSAAANGFPYVNRPDGGILFGNFSGPAANDTAAGLGVSNAPGLWSADSVAGDVVLRSQFGGALNFATGAADGTTTSTKMRITNTGSVGIGTLTPGNDVVFTNGGLTVNGSGSTIMTMQKGGASALALNLSQAVPGDFTLYDKVAGAWHPSITSSNGYVGINGAGSPAAPLHVNGAVLSTGNPAYFASQGAVAAFYAFDRDGSANAAAFYRSGGTNYLWDSTYGNEMAFSPAGIVMTAPGGASPVMTVSGAIHGPIATFIDTAGGYYLGVGTVSPYYSLHIDSAGATAAGFFAPGSVAYLASNGWALESPDWINVGGVVATSDGRLKEDIRDIPGPLQKTLKLRPVSFVWKKNTEQIKRHTGKEYGFIAQDVETVIPELVRELDNNHPSDGSQRTLNQELGKTKSVDYVRMVPFLVGAIQELYLMVMDNMTKMSNDIAQLKRETASLREDVETLKQVVGVCTAGQVAAGICQPGKLMRPTDLTNPVMNMYNTWAQRRIDGEIESVKTQGKEVQDYLCGKDSQAPFCRPKYP